MSGRGGVLAEALRVERARRQLTQQEAASVLCMSAATLSRFESGRQSMPKLDRARRIAEYLGPEVWRRVWADLVAS